MKTARSILTVTLLAGIMSTSALVPRASHAQAAPGGVPPAVAQPPGAAALSDGEVRKIDRETGKITIRHGPIKHLDMPPMSMVFTATDKTLLDRVKVGDKIRFMAADEGGKMMVTEIEPAK